MYRNVMWFCVLCDYYLLYSAPKLKWLSSSFPQPGALTAGVEHPEVPQREDLDVKTVMGTYAAPGFSKLPRCGSTLSYLNFYYIYLFICVLGSRLPLSHGESKGMCRRPRPSLWRWFSSSATEDPGIGLRSQLGIRDLCALSLLTGPSANFSYSIEVRILRNLILYFLQNNIWKCQSSHKNYSSYLSHILWAWGTLSVRSFDSQTWPSWRI